MRRLDRGAQSGAAGADHEHIVLVPLEFRHLEKPHVVPDTHCQKSDVDVGERHPEQTEPRPAHVSAVKTADTFIGLLANGSARQLVEVSAHQVPKGVAPGCVASEQNHVDDDDDGAKPDPETLVSAPPIEDPHRLVRVTGEDHEERERCIKEVAMDVLNDERKGFLAAISLAWLTNGTVGWVRPETLVIRSSVVVAGKPESGRKWQNQERRRKREKRRQPGRTGATDPGVRRIRKEKRRVEGREVVARREILVLKCGPGRVDQEAAEDEEDDERLDPPGVATHGLAEAAAGNLYDFRCH